MNWKHFLGIALIIVGIFIGLYVGVWLMFVGGVIGLVEVVNQLIAGIGLDGMLIAVSIVKIMFAGLVGYLSGIIAVLPGFALFNKD